MFEISKPAVEWVGECQPINIEVGARWEEHLAYADRMANEGYEVQAICVEASDFSLVRVRQEFLNRKAAKRFYTFLLTAEGDAREDVRSRYGVIRSATYYPGS